MPPKVHALTEDELAALAGISKTTWKVHKRDGAPAPRTNADVMTWLVDYHEWRRLNGKSTNDDAEYEPDEATRHFKRELTKLRVVLMRIEVGERTGTLLPRQKVIERNGRAALSVRLRLNLMVKKMASRFGPLIGKDGEAYVEEQMQTEVDSICAAFARTGTDTEAAPGASA